jgi:hypothetical protein
MTGAGSSVEPVRDLMCLFSCLEVADHAYFAVHFEAVANAGGKVHVDRRALCMRSG